jgi:hypothetical protein
VTIEGVTQAPFFLLGAANSTLAASFQVGNTGSPYHTAVFGRRFGVSPPAYQIALFQTFATNVLIESAQFLTLRAIFDVNVISESGAVNFVSQAGSMTFTSVTDMYFVQTGLTSVIKFTPARYFNVSTTYVDFSVSSIGNSIPLEPVTFQDSDGVNFNNTYIFNDGTDPQPLDCGQTGVLIVNDSMVVYGNLTVRGFLYTSNSTSLECPDYSPMPSDERVKQDIREVNTAHAYERITKKMPIKSFRYTDEYLHSPGRAPYIGNATYTGVIAQEVNDDFGYMVSRNKGKLGTRELPDMHSIRPELLYGEIVATLQHVRKLHERLAERVDAMEHRANRFARQAISETRDVLDASLDTGRQALRQLGKEVDKGKAVINSAETQVHRAIGYLHARLERLERAVVG